MKKKRIRVTHEYFGVTHILHYARVKAKILNGYLCMITLYIEDTPIRFNTKWRNRQEKINWFIDLRKSLDENIYHLLVIALNILLTPNKYENYYAMAKNN